MKPKELLTHNPTLPSRFPDCLWSKSHEFLSRRLLMLTPTRNSPLCYRAEDPAPPISLFPSGLAGAGTQKVPVYLKTFMRLLSACTCPLRAGGTPRRIGKGAIKDSCCFMLPAKHFDSEEEREEHLLHNGSWVTLRPVSCVPWGREKVAGFHLHSLIIFFPCQGNDCLVSTSKAPPSYIKYCGWGCRGGSDIVFC